MQGIIRSFLACTVHPALLWSVYRKGELNMAMAKGKEINITLQSENFEEVCYRSGLHVSLRQDNILNFNLKKLGAGCIWVLIGSSQGSCKCGKPNDYLKDF